MFSVFPSNPDCPDEKRFKGEGDLSLNSLLSHGFMKGFNLPQSPRNSWLEFHVSELSCVYFFYNHFFLLL